MCDCDNVICCTAAYLCLVRWCILWCLAPKILSWKLYFNLWEDNSIVLMEVQSRPKAIRLIINQSLHFIQWLIDNIKNWRAQILVESKAGGVIIALIWKEASEWCICVTKWHFKRHAYLCVKRLWHRYNRIPLGQSTMRHRRDSTTVWQQ